MILSIDIFYFKTVIIGGPIIYSITFDNRVILVIDYQNVCYLKIDQYRIVFNIQYSVI